MGVVDYRTIDAAYWQPEIGVLGGVVTDLDDIHQCILTILTTPQGSDPLRPDFALRLLDYVDRPINAIRAPLVRDVVAAIGRWEKRVTITKVQLEPAADGAGWTLQVGWVLSGQSNNEAAQATSVAIPTSAGDVVAAPFVAIPFVIAPPVLSEVDGGVL